VASFGEAYAVMAEALTNGEFDLVNGAFLSYIGEYMQRWLDCLEALESRRAEAAVEVPADD
jgi:hypothetical protein